MAIAAASRFWRHLPGHDPRLELSHAERDPIFAWQDILRLRMWASQKGA